MSSTRSSLCLRLVEGRSIRIALGGEVVDISLVDVEPGQQPGSWSSARLRFLAPRCVRIMRSDAKHILETTDDAKGT